MHYFSNKFLKIAKRPQRPFIFNTGDLKLRDLTKLMVFQTDCDEIELEKKLVMTSSPLRQPNNVTIFFILLPNQNFWLRQQPVGAKAQHQ